MKIGLSSASFYPNVETENSIKIMKNLGFELGELFINTPSEYSIGFLNKIKVEKEKYNFNIVSLHAFSTFFELYLFDAYKRRRRDMLKQYKVHCDFAKEIGAKYYTFHGMRISKLNSGRLKLIKNIYEELAYIALEKGIRLAQENVCWCQSSQVEFIEFLKEEVKNPVYFTLDIKQAYRAKKSPYKYMKVMGDRLVNIHINDKDKKSSCLLPGKGDVNYKYFFNKLNKSGYKGDAIIEVYRENYGEYEELKETRKFLESKFKF